jgi:Nucleotidyl transferase AbiEii toxin, Type IV TA system
VLTPHQEQVARIIAGVQEAKDFALAGGAALIARGDVQRETRDLDFFGLTADAVDRLVPAVDPVSSSTTSRSTKALRD